MFRVSCQEEDEESQDAFQMGFGFTQSKPKAQAKKTTKESVAKSSRSSRASAKRKGKSPKAAEREEKELKALQDGAEEAVKKLEQLSPKCLWNKTLTEREVTARLSRASSLLVNLTLVESEEVGGLKNQLQTKLEEVQQSKTLIAQLQSWSGDLEEILFRSSAFVKWFCSIDSTLQQTLLLHLGTKMIEAFDAVPPFRHLSTVARICVLSSVRNKRYGLLVPFKV